MESCFGGANSVLSLIKSSRKEADCGADEAAAIASATTKVNAINARLESKTIKFSLIRSLTVFLIVNFNQETCQSNS